MIISLGGGTPCYFDTMDILIQNENVLTIYLKTSIQELGNRLFPTRKNRPLIAHLHNEDELKEFVGKHLFERVPFYSKSNITISTDLLRPEEVALKLASKLT
jgi:shikimate kinase